MSIKSPSRVVKRQHVANGPMNSESTDLLSTESLGEISKGLVVSSRPFMVWKHADACAFDSR